MELRNDNLYVWLKTSNWNSLDFSALLKLGGYLVESKYGALPFSPGQLQALQSIYPEFFLLTHSTRMSKEMSILTLPTTKLENYLNLKPSPSWLVNGKLKFHFNHPDRDSVSPWHIMHIIPFTGEINHYCTLLAKLPFQISPHWQERNKFWEDF